MNLLHSILRCLFECGEIKGKYKDVSIVLYLSGSREFVKILKEFDKEGYFNEIFIGGEEMRLIEFIRKDES